MNENNQPKKYYHRHRSIFGPLLLIALGVAFLLNNLGVLPGDFWDVIVSLWPLLIVFAGIDGLVRREGVVWPSLLIAGGTFLLLRNFDLVTWYGWGSLWKLWPLILVAVGVDLIFKNQPRWTVIFPVGLVLLLVLGGIWLTGFSGEFSASSPIDAQQTLEEGISRARLHIALGAGKLHLGESAQTGWLVEGEIGPETGHEQYSESDGVAIYTLKSHTPQLSPAQGRWDLNLSTQVPLELRAEMGAGEMDLTLEKLGLENLVVEQGIGSLRLRLPDGKIYSAQVDQAIGQIRISVPQGVALRVEVSKALSVLDLPRDFSHQGAYYFSPDYSEGDEAIALKINQAIGNIKVEYSR
ncbi:MAG: hypothetical protein MAG431_01469 [Chloroflexi bacterium]|nr:hypothetical protein [Chloroflexota bacterium]